jgi:hypothetical protein
VVTLVLDRLAHWQTSMRRPHILVQKMELAAGYWF